MRGPIGALKHLIREAEEAIKCPSNIMEYADCFLLICDAARRAGFTCSQLVSASEQKLEIVKTRTYIVKAQDDEPVEHER